MGKLFIISDKQTTSRLHEVLHFRRNLSNSPKTSCTTRPTILKQQQQRQVLSPLGEDDNGQ